MVIFIIFVLFIIWLFSLFFVVLFMEFIVIFVINKKKLLEELKCDYCSGIFLLIYDKEMIIIVSFIRRFL